VVDVADFTNPIRNVPDLMAVQEGVYDVLKTAFVAMGVDFGSCATEDRGDGMLILVPSSVSKSQLADLLPDRLVAELRRYNSTRVAEAQFKLRIGLHAGDIRKNEHGWVGHAINHTCRIVEAQDAKTALAESEGLLAVIASEYVYTEVIEQDPGAAPEAYRQIDVAVKKFTAKAWLRLPGVDLIRMPKTQANVPPRRAASTMIDDGQAVLGVIPAEELEALRDWLDGAKVEHLPVLASRAAGPAIPASGLQTAWEVFRYLADFNAGPDGIPPALVFLDLLAYDLDEEVGASVVAWVEKQARRLRLLHRLEDRRRPWSPIPAEPCLHLVIALEPDAIDSSRCVMSFWRQDDPLEWKPSRGGVREVFVDELEYRVDDVIVEAERVWSGQAFSAAVEFLVPRNMLHLPIHRWSKEHETADPRPLVYDYHLSFRSLERMRAEHWHRAWRVRWGSMSVNPSASRVHPFGATQNRGYPIDAMLSDSRWVGMVAETPPFVRLQPGAGPDALMAALRAGLPLIMWHPTAGPAELRGLVDWLVGGDGGFADLLSRRKEACTSAPSPNYGDLVRDLVVLWDDPNRLIVPGQPSIPAQQ
jgi:class 3 adenylate cyclase